jgi:Fur family transcriptional regulator, ferric uptake regulator
MGKSAKKLDLDSLREELRKAGLRATGPRVAVLRCLHAAPDAVSHSDLSTELAPEGWDRATVYRNLMDLTEAGLLKRIDHGDHTWRFSLRKNEADQYKQAFFVCDVSGEMTPLPQGSVTITVGRGAPKALKAGEYVVHVRGVGDKFRKER